MTAVAFGETASALAEQALAQVGADPRRAGALAEEAALLARRQRDPGARSTALRAAGLAAKALGDLSAALESLRAAVRVAARAGLAEQAAEARMSLAFALLDRGRIAAALREADIAASTLRGLAAARLLSQRALILQRVGRVDEAIAAYRKALPVLRRNADRHWEARLLNNRAVLNAYRGELGPAEEDLRRAHDLHLAAGRELEAAETEWNLGFVYARRGDIPRALAHLDSAERSHRRFGVRSPELLLDRADVLLSARLLTEAVRSAGRAVEHFRAAGKESGLAEGLLLLAQTELAADKYTQAVEHARESAQLFRAQGRDSWQRVADYLTVRAHTAATAPSHEVVRAAQRAAAAMADAGWRALELDARLLAAVGATTLGDHESALEQLRLASRARRSGPVELRARAWYAEALLRTSGGDRRGAMRAVAAGLRAVEGYRAALGATELRVHGAGHGADLSRLGLRLAIEGGSPRRVFAWSERWRAGALMLRPVRPPEDANLAGLLAEYRRVTAELDAALLTQRPSAHLAREQAMLEAVIQRSTRHSQGLHAPPLVAPTLDQLRRHLGDHALLSLFELDGELHGLVMSDGRVRHQRLAAAPAVSAAQDALRFALRRLAHGHGTARSLAHAREATVQAAAQIDAAIFDPVRQALGDRPLVVVSTGALLSLPWSLLPSCAGRTVSIAPSASVWLRARNRDRMPLDQRSCFIAGPRLVAATSEVTSIAKTYVGATCLTGSAATTSATLAALDGASVAHVAAHGQIRADNPLFSALELHDGSLTVYDLETLNSAPQLVLLPACESGVTSVAAADELMGLTAAFLALGTRALVAAVLPLPDQTTAPFMSRVHAGLLAGLDPAAALATAQTETDKDDPLALVTSAAFVCFGAGS